MRCNKCKGAYSFSNGIKGKNADITKLLFVLHRSDSRANIPVLPGLGFDDYERAFMKTPSGKVISDLLNFCGLTFDNIYLTNLFKCLLPLDRNPTEKEYQNCLSVLEEQVKDFKPSKIVVFGAKAKDRMLKSDFIISPIGIVYEYLGAVALTMEHPSAPWLRNENAREHYFREVAEFIIPT